MSPNGGENNLTKSCPTHFYFFRFTQKLFPITLKKFVNLPWHFLAFYSKFDVLQLPFDLIYRRFDQKDLEHVPPFPVIVSPSLRFQTLFVDSKKKV